MNGYTLLGILVAVIGVWGLQNPGGWDWLSMINVFMGGLMVGVAALGRGRV